MAVEYLGDGRPDGTCLGQSATEKVAFFGETPVVQQATIAATTTDSAAVIAVNLKTLITELQNLGLLADS